MIKLGEKYKNITTKDLVYPKYSDSENTIYRKKEPEIINGAEVDEFTKPTRVFEQLYRLVK